MDQNNGGIIGKINTPTTTVASGVWSLDSQFESQAGSTWPLAFPQTTIANSCRFDDGSSDYLVRTPASSGNRQTFTISFWYKRTTPGTSGSFIRADNGTGQDGGIRINTDSIQFFDNDSTLKINLQTTQVLRDVSAWYHIMCVADTTNATSGDRALIYLNGSRVTDLSSATYPTQNLNFASINNSSFAQNIGRSENFATYLDGYLAEFCFIDGQALDPTSFGAFNPVTNIWEPIAYAGTYGTNGFRLDFADSSALGNDVSGNNNDFTVNNLTSVDQSTDTCSNNFATYNSIFGMGRQDQLTYSEGNTVVVSGATSGGDTTATSTFAFDSGKWYAEFKLTSDADGAYIGVATSNFNFTNSGVDTSAQSENWIVRGDDGTVRNNSSTAYFGTSFSNNDIIQIAIDMDNSKIWWGLNGTYANSGNPATGSNPAFSNLSGELMIIVGDNFSSKTPTIKANFGSPAFSISSGNSDGNGYGNFEYSVPSGYYAINTKNLAEYG